VTLCDLEDLDRADPAIDLHPPHLVGDDLFDGLAVHVAVEAEVTGVVVPNRVIIASWTEVDGVSRHGLPRPFSLPSAALVEHVAKIGRGTVPLNGPPIEGT
jgi:hypothetical protein